MSQGQVVGGRCVLQDLIGQGSFGTIWRATGLDEGTASQLELRLYVYYPVALEMVVMSSRRGDVNKAPGGRGGYIKHV